MIQQRQRENKTRASQAPSHALAEVCGFGIPFSIILRNKLKYQNNLKVNVMKNKSTYSDLYHGKIITTKNSNEINYTD